MELWYTEEHTKNVRFSIKVDKQLVTKKSKFQRIDIFESKEFGRFLTLDGFMMLTEKDEFIYHEMIVHIPMAVKNDAKKILVIGAGDGGTVRELVKYDSIERIDMVEIDKEVVDICREYLPKTACKLDDPRVNLYYEDGLKFVRSKTNEYDIVIVDSTDPFGPGEDLFTREFYGNCYNALKEDGILVNQHESPYYEADAEATQRAVSYTHLGLSGSAFIFPQAMLSEISAEISERKKVGLEGFLFGIQGLFLKLSFLVQQVAVSIVIVFGSQKSVTGLKTATDLGVRSTLIVAFILFGISLFFYNLKKED